jgi:TPP-dependent pyruvate/acetoin dehydrogenase alpha subunit
VGTQPLHAVGLSYGIKYREKDDVVATFFGDGATSEGDFHEAMNFAGVWQFQQPVGRLPLKNDLGITAP